MKSTIIVAIVAFTIGSPEGGAQISPAGAAKPLQAVSQPSPADRAKLAEWEKILAARRPQGSSKQAALKQVDDFTAKQTAIHDLASAQARAHAARLLSSVVAEKDEDNKVRTEAVKALRELLDSFAVPAADVDAIFASTFALLDRKGDSASVDLRLELISIGQAILAQPQLTPAKKKAYEERVTQLLARENTAAAATIRDAGAKILKIKPSSSDVEQGEALTAIKQLDKVARNRSLSPANHDHLLATLTEGLNRRYNRFYHFGEIAQAIEKLGDPKAIPALEAFIKAHPSDKIDPNVNGYVLGLCRRAVQTLQAAGKK